MKYIIAATAIVRSVRVALVGLDKIK